MQLQYMCTFYITTKTCKVFQMVHFKFLHNITLLSHFKVIHSTTTSMNGKMVKHTC